MHACVGDLMDCEQHFDGESCSHTVRGRVWPLSSLRLGELVYVPVAALPPLETNPEAEMVVSDAESGSKDDNDGGGDGNVTPRVNPPRVDWTTGLASTVLQDGKLHETNIEDQLASLQQALGSREFRGRSSQPRISPTTLTEGPG